MPCQVSPYVCHVFVCTHDKCSERKACATTDPAKFREQLKALVQQNPALQGKVRVSVAGCLGVCAQGPNVMIYPQGLWFSGVTPADAPHLLVTIEALVAGREPPA
ncbi:MAG: (2Fe-2S) ferredoxin domain-containing protein [Verrucomicrobia bacterium]|nr:MAG: (2Fe-2S) ferredoxin domain-containing protein [Verrucomicrobiota bacterium]